MANILGIDNNLVQLFQVVSQKQINTGSKYQNVSYIFAFPLTRSFRIASRFMAGEITTAKSMPFEKASTVLPGCSILML